MSLDQKIRDRMHTYAIAALQAVEVDEEPS